jgi:hypothetical protein
VTALAEAPVGRRQTVLLTPATAATVMMLSVPITFFEAPVVAGVLPSGFAWMIGGAAAAACLVTLPLSGRVFRPAVPYLAFLGVALVSLAWTMAFAEGVPTLVQMVVPLLAYVVAWRMPLEVLHDTMAPIARVLVLVALVLVAADVALGGLPLVELSVRPLGISLSILVVLALAGRPSFRDALVYGGAGTAASFMTGSRVASVVIVILVLSSPGLAVRLWARFLIIALAVALLLAFAETPAFKERFFHDPEQATLGDAFWGSPQLNTAGRGELWPKLVDRCGPAQPLGLGLGSTDPLSFGLTDGAMVHPHNEYLRVWCETGVVGSIGFWGFFVLLAGRRLVALTRGRGDRLLQAAAAQAVLALLLFAITDNPILYTAHFMVPAMLLMGLAEAEASRAPRLSPAERRIPASS